MDKYDPKIIAVSKTFSEQDILPLLNFGHHEFGENKVQEAVQKWKNLKEKYSQVRLHMLGKLQTNKVKNAVEIFDYIHSLDNLKLANKLAKEIHEKNKEIKIFIQINLGGEKQKSGIEPSNLEVFYKNCLALKLNIIGPCSAQRRKPKRLPRGLVARVRIRWVKCGWSAPSTARRSTRELTDSWVKVGTAAASRSGLRLVWLLWGPFPSELCRWA